MPELSCDIVIAEAPGKNVEVQVFHNPELEVVLNDERINPHGKTKLLNTFARFGWVRDEAAGVYAVPVTIYAYDPTARIFLGNNSLKGIRVDASKLGGITAKSVQLDSAASLDGINAQRAIYGLAAIVNEV